MRMRGERKTKQNTLYRQAKSDFFVFAGVWVGGMHGIVKDSTDFFLSFHYFFFFFRLETPTPLLN